MKQNFKKLLSAICALCLILSACFVGVMPVAAETVQTEDIKATSTDVILDTDAIGEDFKWVTASDFHTYVLETLAATYTGKDADFYHDKNANLDKFAFSAKVNFASSGTHRLYFGGGWNGVFFNGSGDNLVLYNYNGGVIKTFTPAVAGAQLTGNADLKLTVSFEFVNNDGTNTDLKMGVFFNGVLYNNEYFTALTAYPVANLKQVAKLYVSGSSLTLGDVPVRVPTYLEEITTSSLGFAYGTNSVRTNKIGRNTVDGLLFGVNVTFADANQWLQYGGTDSWYGVRVQLSGTSLLAGPSNGDVSFSATFDPATALGEGYTTFVGTNFDLHISSEVVNHDGDDTLDVRYGFFFNGKLYNNQYWYSYDKAPVLGNYIGFQNATPPFAPAAAISGKSVREDLTQLSFNDITADSNGYSSLVMNDKYVRKGIYAPASNLAGTTFIGNVTLVNNTKESFLQIGGTGDWNGIRFIARGDNIVIESGGVTGTIVKPSFIGESTFNGTPITVALSTEIKNLDGGETANDVVYGAYINGKFVTTLYAFDYADSLGNRVVCENWDTGSTFSAAEKTVHVSAPTDLVDLSFNNFGFVDGTYANNVGTLGECDNYDIDNLTEALFTGYVNFSDVRTTTAGSSNPAAFFCYGAPTSQADGSDGLRISNHHTWVPTADGILNVTFSNMFFELYPEVAGVDLINNEFKLQIHIIPADFDGDGFETDARIGLFINDKLYNDTYFNKAGALENLGTYTRIYTYGSSMTVASPAEVLPENMAVITPNELGIAGEWAAVGNSGVAFGTLSSNWTANSNTGEAMSLVGTTVSMDITYTNENYIHLATTSAGSWSGIRVQTMDGYIVVENTLTGGKVICYPETAGVDFTKKFNLKLTFMPSGENDVKVGIWFNDKLYGNMYRIWTDVADQLTASANLIPFDRTDAPATITLSADRYVPTAEDGYTVKDIINYGFSYKTYTGNSEAHSISGLTTDKLVVSGKIAVTGNGHLVVVGDWLGYWLGINWTNSAVELRHTNGIFGNPINIPLEDIASGKFAFDLVQTIVDADADGEADDVQIDLWINNKSDRSYFFMDYASQATSTTLRVFPDGGSVTVLENLDTVYENGEYYNLADGAYLVTAPTAKGETVYSVGDEITVPGDYVITVSDELANITRYVYLYKAGDVSPDGEMDIRDLIAAKTIAAGTELTKSGAKALDVTGTNNFTKNIIAIKRVLLGSAQLPEQVNYLSYAVDETGSAVMPISGFWGPRTINPDIAGMETNMVQDKYYKLIADMGINLINYIEADATSSETMIMQNLSLAEKYNMGVFVNDVGVTGDMTKSQLANYLAKYAKYGSFYGIHTADEPRTDSYANTSANATIDSIAAKSVLLNSYTNLNAYVNLFPLMDTESKYIDYLNEYLAKCSPRYISYDHYPFTSGRNWGDYNAFKSYFMNLNAVRDKSNETGLPFWAYIQVGGNYTTDAVVTDNNLPTESMLMWNVNTTLAYGAKGIQYFPLVQPNYYGIKEKDENGNITSFDFERNGLIGADGNTTKWYDYAKKANAWIATVDGILMNATSKAVIGKGSYVQNASYLNLSDTYEDVKLYVSNESYGAIVGVFDYNGKTAYYVVNNRYNSTDDTVSYDDVALDFTSEKTATIYYSKSEGAVSASGKTITVQIEAGGAALIVVD